METAKIKGSIYEFENFRLVPDEGLLLRNGEPVELNRKAFNVLALLVEHNGHLVEKSKILDLIWEDSFVEEGVLSKAIWSIRQALGDTSKERFIQTVPRRGYRFVYPVSIIADGSGAFRLSDIAAANNSDNSFPSQAEIPAPSYPVERPILANPKDDSLGKGLPARSFGSRGWRRVALYAGVAVLLLAGVSLYAILNASFDTKIRPLPDRGTQNEEAYRLYQQAENLSHRRDEKDRSLAMDNLNEAVALDPNFARAWAAKALLHPYMATRNGADRAEHYRKALDAVEKALRIDPNISEAHSALCLNKLRYEFDFAGAERDCKRALDLDPDSSVGHKVYAVLLFSSGRFNESIAEAKRAIDLQPLALDHQQTYALALYYAKRYSEEEAQWKRLIELYPTYDFLYYRLYMNLAQQGKDDEAFDNLIQVLTLHKADNETVERFRTAFVTSGWRGVTIERIKRPGTETAGSFDIAGLYASLGDKDKAFEYLEKALKERHYRMAVLKVEPLLDPLHDDPRWADLVRRVEGK